MKTTDWKDLGSVRRMRVTYGMDKIGEQEPRFSITAEIQRQRQSIIGLRWYDDFERLHVPLDLAVHFPELAGLRRWHGCGPDTGPVMYCLAQGREDDFRSMTVFGAVADDEAAWAVASAGGPEMVRAWLKARLPALLLAFRADLAAAEVEL